MTRLNKFLAAAGFGSRRKVEALITDGKVKINGAVVKDLSTQVDSAKDEVICEGKAVKAAVEYKYLVLNKPRGYIVSASDELGRQTIYSLLPEFAAGYNYAGRLDKNSEGLLLITNDGNMINRLAHPSFKVEKVYKCDINRKLSKAQLEILRTGVEIEGGRTRPAGIFVKAESDSAMSLKVVITEGRKRQIRLMIEAVGAKVTSLKRLQFGPLKLKELPSGRWRFLTDGELKALKTTIDKGIKQ